MPGNPKNTTPIDLIDLDELEHSNIDPFNNEKHRKYIRASIGSLPIQSGMNSNYNQVFSSNKYNLPENGNGHYQYQGQDQGHYQQNQGQYQQNQYQQNQGQQNQGQYMLNDSPSCIDVHEHIQRCPICSRFFKTDNTIYIITIVILAIVCILLLKRVLNL